MNKIETAIEKYLINNVAKKRTVTTYKAIGDHFGLPYEHDAIGKFLGPISEKSFNEHGVLLSALVQRFDGDIGSGFYEVAWELGVEGLNDSDFLAKHRERIYEIYST